MLLSPNLFAQNQVGGWVSFGCVRLGGHLRIGVKGREWCAGFGGKGIGVVSWS
jgi:hypothetical protein